MPLKNEDCGFFFGGDAVKQEAFFFATANGQHAVGGGVFDRLLPLEVVAVFRAFDFFARKAFGDERAVLPKELAQRLAGVGVVTDPFGDDVARTFERSIGVGHFLFGIDVGQCLFGGVAGVLVLEEMRGEWLEAALASDHRFGAALGAERQVDVFELGECGCGVDLAVELVG